MGAAADTNNIADTHDPFPGFIAFNTDPELLFGPRDSPRSSTQLQQQLSTHLVGYAVGEWSGVNTYEIVAAYTHQDYRSLGLARDMYNGIFLHLPLSPLNFSSTCSKLCGSCGCSKSQKGDASAATTECKGEEEKVQRNEGNQE